ncbi:MAG: hypothetical protein ACQEV0_08450 [Bacillota bacterium]
MYEDAVSFDTETQKNIFTITETFDHGTIEIKFAVQGNNADLCFTSLSDKQCSNGKSYRSGSCSLDKLNRNLRGGNEPSVEQIESLLNQYPNSTFDVTFNLTENKKIREVFAKSIVSKDGQAAGSLDHFDLFKWLGAIWHQLSRLL